MGLDKGLLSVPDKLVLAAFDLEERGKRPFSAEDLVVEAWRKYPDAFGLSGHADQDGKPIYPDSNRVFAEIMGSKPIRKRGLLRKVGRKMYQLTEAGREYARVAARQGVGEVVKATVAREVKVELVRLLSSRAVEKARAGRFDDITFFDACTFWAISPGSSAMDLDGKIGNLQGIFKAVEESAQNKVLSLEHGGLLLRPDDLRLLRELHTDLMKRFGEELEIIHRRTDERR
jgi:hypothetical protein